MLLTQCAACATELGLTLGKKCGRCSTRYCGPECQRQHWEEGGHDQLCKTIKKAGGAEQYNANNKYAEAVAVAVEECRGRHEGQKCYICLEAVHSRTGEGLVRGCACGDRDGVSSPELGVAHVSCLARQAQVAVERRSGPLYLRWRTCGLCEQDYHGVVSCALGWACWKTYLGRPEKDQIRCMAMNQLGNGLCDSKQYEDALSVYKADLAMMRRLGAPEEHLLVTQGNLAATYSALGRHEEALQLERDVYSGRLRLNGEEHEKTLRAANNYAASLKNYSHFGEAKSLLRKTIPAARRVLGDSSDLTLTMRRTYAAALYADDSSTPDDLREAVTTLEDTARTARHVLGDAHPSARAIEGVLRKARAALRAREEAAPCDVSSVCEGIAAMTPEDA